MSVLFCTPCYGSMVTTPHMRSCVDLKEHLTRAGIEHDWLLGDNESLIHRGRMKMVKTFLETSFDFLMWLDADIEFTAHDVAALWNLAADGNEICVGVYPMKKPGQSWYAAWHKGALVKDLDSFKEPIEVDFAGTGFMLISRKAIKKVIAHIRAKYEVAKELRKAMGDPLDMKKQVADEMLDAMAPEFSEDIGTVPALFTAHTYNGGLESEDYHFCRVAREAGLKIMMHPQVRLAHWGRWAYGKHEDLVRRV